MICRAFVLSLALLLSIACSGAKTAWADPIRVFVSIAPQKYFVEQIGKAQVVVQVMVPPGASPATYEPKPRQMAAMAKARAYFSIGVPFERAWLPRFKGAHAKMKIVATDHGIQKLAMAAHEHEDDHHEADDHDKHDKDDHAPHGEDEHGHDGLDPHIWTSPLLVKVQARTILTALQKLDPAHADQYADNYNAFEQELDALHKELQKVFKPYQGQRFMVFHPSWGYFAHTYGLVQVPVEVEGKAPKPAQLKALITHARSELIKVIFVQPQFSAKSAKLIASAIGGNVITADPLALDWANNLRRQAKQFKAALR